jgi:hypothetical protein
VAATRLLTYARETSYWGAKLELAAHHVQTAAMARFKRHGFDEAEAGLMRPKNVFAKH